MSAKKKKVAKNKAAKPKSAAAKRKPAATKKPTGKAARGKAVPKKAALGKAARGKAARGKAGKSPRLGLVPKPAKKPAKPAARSFPQTEGASSKQMVVFRLLKARARLLAALQGLITGAAEQPLGENKWNTREIVLHLCCRDRVRLREFESTLRGVPPSWRGLSKAENDRNNAADLQPISHLAWDEALRLLHSTRESLMDAIDGVPEEPAEVWSPDHPFGWMLNGLPAHDQHHAEIVKQWRAEAGA